MLWNKNVTPTEVFAAHRGPQIHFQRSAPTEICQIVPHFRYDLTEQSVKAGIAFEITEFRPEVAGDASQGR